MHKISESIRELSPKIKAFLRGISGDILVALLFIITTFLAFGLGRLSGIQHNTPPVAFVDGPLSIKSLAGQQTSTVGDHTPPEESSQGAIVASKKGTKYHFPWCPGALQMSETNKIYFDSEDAARQAGYSPASNCKGLK